MTDLPIPARGELWWAQLDPVHPPQGHGEPPRNPGEQAMYRPVLVLSPTDFNSWRSRLAIVVPLTTHNRGLPHHVVVTGSGLTKESFAMPEQLRSMHQRRFAERLGEAEAASVKDVEIWVRRFTGL